MIEIFRDTMALVGLALDAIGVLIIAAGAVAATLYALGRREASLADRYRTLRENLGRAILVGLEFIIAGDIIRSVVVHPTLGNVAVLGLIILIRSFLGMMLHLEVEGRWPWQRLAGRSASSSPGEPR
jgi:uncharacterized membrane protein